MRFWITAMLAALFPNFGAQDAAPPPPSSEAASITSHPICSGDAVTAKRAVILEGYGTGGFPVSTRIIAVQAFFDNGMQLGAAFAHKASIAAFQQAEQLDPDCAMCIWGEAWSSGPTINYGIEPKDAAKLAVLLVRAESLARATGTDLERTLIAALKLRYIADTAPGSANLAFAKAMDTIAVAHPKNDALATLAADAWLIAASDMKVWRPPVYRSVALLQDVLARDANYSPAIHFYIHATEIAEFPARAEPFADRRSARAAREPPRPHALAPIIGSGAIRTPPMRTCGRSIWVSRMRNAWGWRCRTAFGICPITRTTSISG